MATKTAESMPSSVPHRPPPAAEGRARAQVPRSAAAHSINMELPGLTARVRARGGLVSREVLGLLDNVLAAARGSQKFAGAGANLRQNASKRRAR